MPDIIKKLVWPDILKYRKHIPSLPLVITVYDLKDDAVIGSEELDYGQSEHRALIGKITIWAIEKGYSVETMSKVDFENNNK